jgi:hypothetical protein
MVGVFAVASALLTTPAWAGPAAAGSANPASSFSGAGPGNPGPAVPGAPRLRAPVKPARIGTTQLSFSNFTVAYSPYGQLSVNGILLGDSLMTNFTVDLQFSPDGVSNWTTARTLTTSINSADPFVFHFSASFFQQRSGFWRAQYNGDPEHGISDSGVVKAWRWATFFPTFKVSAHRVPLRSHFTVSGTLDRWFSNTRKGGYAGRTVEIIFRPVGTKTWYLLAKTNTNSRGAFAKSVVAYGSGTYEAIFTGGSGTFASGSATAYVRA